MDYQGKCSKCRKRKDCKVPCAFVDEILKQGNPQLFERTSYSENLTMVYPPNKLEKRESNMRAGARDKVGHQKVDGIFSDENDKAWAEFDADLKQTNVFIQRALLGKSWKEIAQLYETTTDHAQKLYCKAHKRMLKALELSDSHQTKLDKAKHALKVNEQATGKLPKYQKWFLMNKCLGLMPTDIAELENVKRVQVTSKIRQCADRLKTGNLTFLDPTPEQVDESQARIDKKRARDRK